jgi:succinate dehydrogenase / fumarate reductase iron-sulfur subunit
MAEVTVKIWRGDAERGGFVDYVVTTTEGERILDVIQRIQAEAAPDLACRWNCNAGKCGSCLAEINGLARLMCTTRVDQLLGGAPIRVAPNRTFPLIRDLVSDVSFNYETASKRAAFSSSGALGHVG